LIRRFQKEANIFGEWCGRWLGSIIQYTEILKYYLQYQIFTSEYLTDCGLTPLTIQGGRETIIPESDILELQLDSDSDYISRLIEQEVTEARSTVPFCRNTRSGRIIKPVNLPNKELQKR